MPVGRCSYWALGVKFFGPTIHRGAKWRISGPHGSVWIPYCYEEGIHMGNRALEAYVKKFGLPPELLENPWRVYDLEGSEGGGLYAICPL